MENLPPSGVHPWPPPKRSLTQKAVIVSVLVSSALALGGFALFYALALAFSGAFRDVVGARGTGGGDLPVLSKMSHATTGISAVAVTEKEGVWAYGVGGVGSNCHTFVLEKNAAGEACWRWAAELESGDRLFEFRGPAREGPMGFSPEQLHEGPSELVYLPRRDSFLLANEQTGRLIYTSSTKYQTDKGTEEYPYGRGNVLTRLQRAPKCLAVSSDEGWLAVGMQGDKSYPDDDYTREAKRAYGPLVLLRWHDSQCAVERDLAGHVGSVHACCFAADGSFLVSGGNDATVRVWTLPDGNLKHCWNAAGPVTSVSVSTDGERIAYCSERGHIEVRTLAGELLHALTDHVAEPPTGNTRQTYPVFAAFSPDGKWLAVTESCELTLRPATGGSVSAKWRPGDGEYFGGMSWSPSGNKLGVFTNTNAYVLGVNLKE